MNYKYRVTLAGLKGFFRVYSVNAENTLYTFHKQLQSDMEFPTDQPILFKALDEAGNVVARYALIDLGFGTVDAVKVSKVIKDGATQFVYFYDIAGKKSVIITLEGECDVKTVSPTLLEVKGPNPIEFENGYVAFEDLPEEKRNHKPHHCDDPDCDGECEDCDEDEDEDEEGEEEEDDETEEIYDEKEEF